MDEERAPDRHLYRLILAGLLLAALPEFLNDARHAEVTAGIVEEVKARACISQAAPSERMPKPVCAGGYEITSALPYPGVVTSYWTDAQ